MNHYVEFDGGLGDIFLRIFLNDEYRAIQQLPAQDHVQISLITNNPFAYELFEWHPKSQQMDVAVYPPWSPEEDKARRAQYGLPKKRKLMPPGPEAVEFYTSSGDRELLYLLREQPYFVIAAGGDEARAFPESIISMVFNEAAALQTYLVGVGRNYPEERAKRREPDIPQGDYAIDLIDQLSVPGTAKLVERSAGVICTHSSICHLAWMLNKPVLLLYPRPVYEKHILSARSGYTRGLDRPSTRHALFEECNHQLAREFLMMAMGNRR